MVMKIEKLAEEFDKKGFRDTAYALKVNASQARRLGVPEYFPENGTASFEIPTVSETLCLKVREALAGEGYTFIIPIKPLSIGQLVAADRATRQRFGSVHPSEKIRSIVPPQMEVAINPNNLRIIDSNNKTTNDQIEMLRKEEVALKAKLPQEVRDLISIRLQNASVLAQVDDEYQRRTGTVLFTDWSGRTDDQTVPGDGITVGRNTPTSGLDVVVWGRGVDFIDVFAVLMVVLPRRAK